MKRLVFLIIILLICRTTIGQDVNNKCELFNKAIASYIFGTYFRVCDDSIGIINIIDIKNIIGEGCYLDNICGNKVSVTKTVNNRLDKNIFFHGIRQYCNVYILAFHYPPNYEPYINSSAYPFMGPTLSIILLELDDKIELIGTSEGDF